MGNFFKSLFSSSKVATPEEEKSKNDQKNFDILKYDGVRAQKIGQVAYAIKCFTEALKLQEDFETMTYLVAAYTTANKADEALEVLNRMVELEPDHINTLLTRVNVLFMLDKDVDVIADCRHILELEETNHLAWFLMGKAKRTTSDPLGAIADLTKAIALKEDFTDCCRCSRQPKRFPMWKKPSRWLRKKKHPTCCAAVSMKRWAILTLLQPITRMCWS